MLHHFLVNRGIFPRLRVMLENYSRVKGTYLVRPEIIDGGQKSSHRFLRICVDNLWLRTPNLDKSISLHLPVYEHRCFVSKKSKPVMSYRILHVELLSPARNAGFNVSGSKTLYSVPAPPDPSVVLCPP